MDDKTLKLWLLRIIWLCTFLLCLICSTQIYQYYQRDPVPVRNTQNYSRVNVNPYYTHKMTYYTSGGYGETTLTISFNSAKIILDSEPGSDLCQYSELTARGVFSGKLRVPQDDSKLLGFVKKCIFTPPSPLAYNLTDPTGHHFSPVESVQKYVLSLLGNKRHGVFVDFGANDGEVSSNTLVLERDFGWSGLLIEADPKNAEKFLEKRRKAWVANACVGIHPYPYETEMYRFKDTKLRPRLAEVEGGFCSNGPEEWSKTKIKVRCLPLYTLVAALDLKDLDYMSMGDVDGVELKVLNTLPFDKIKVKVFSIETMPENSEAVRAFMHSKGYAFVKTIPGKYLADDVFAHKSLLNDTVQDVVIDANAKI